MIVSSWIGGPPTPPFLIGGFAPQTPLWGLFHFPITILVLLYFTNIFMIDFFVFLPYFLYISLPPQNSGSQQAP